MEFVYFVRGVETGRIKIGQTCDPVKRLAAMQTGCSEKLVLAALVPGAVEEERVYQRTFSEWCLWSEWFSPAPELLRCIAELRAKEDPAWREPQETKVTWELPAALVMRMRAVTKTRGIVWGRELREFLQSECARLRQEDRE